MKRNKLVALCAFAFCAVVAGVAVSNTFAFRPIGGPCGPQYCLDVWDPVICSNGQVYSNACYAARACATGCQPLNF